MGTQSWEWKILKCGVKRWHFWGVFCGEMSKKRHFSLRKHKTSPDKTSEFSKQDVNRLMWTENKKHSEDPEQNNSRTRSSSYSSSSSSSSSVSHHRTIKVLSLIRCFPPTWSRVKTEKSVSSVPRLQKESAERVTSRGVDAVGFMHVRAPAHIYTGGREGRSSVQQQDLWLGTRIISSRRPQKAPRCVYTHSSFRKPSVLLTLHLIRFLTTVHLQTAGVKLLLIRSRKRVCM